MDGLIQGGSWYTSCGSVAILGPNSTDWVNVEQSPGMEEPAKGRPDVKGKVRHHFVSIHASRVRPGKYYL
ncbi:hypothetical protein L207DRAFT_506133 [Hyaloscypha variabilis F]|uniref:Uncharacterized protein n=1 Tax=Hyaloscypha variabilis (strain UAMH 11265 / GT02V1 / F) TaxID=1149755 RepID=A0A2J6S8J6_HYAVF|nr:hypothetical protein L207DRAFT_506133 [Hyaloscypha variabilis F]